MLGKSTKPLPPLFPEAAMSKLRRCDLILKGGITSGVVYPKLILTLARHYRFCSIGGTSAGAIAAAFAAAAELNRSGGGFARLGQIPQHLGAQLLTLFQPVPSMRGPFRLLQTILSLGKDGKLSRRNRAWAYPLGLGALALSPLLVATSLWAMVRCKRLLRDLARNGFGFCPGTTQAGWQEPGLTDWLDAQLEYLSGNTSSLHSTPPPRPLCFGDLEDAGIHLRTMTTDLGRQCPIALPGKLGMAMARSDMETLLPARHVAWLMRRGHRLGEVPVTGQGGTAPPELYSLPVGRDFPVLLAVRLSLSFPLLLSAVPLYQRDHSRRLLPQKLRPYQPSFFSDGGITSNFPIHLFDAPLPTRPTFGISLECFHADRQQQDENGQPGKNRVYLPKRAASGLQRPVRSIDSLPSFLAAILDAARNWQDALQSLHPGYRERIVHISLKEHEGGLNLHMSPSLVEQLGALGGLAGEELLEFDMEEHAWRRLLASYASIEEAFEQLAKLRHHPEFSYDDLLKRVLSQAAAGKLRHAYALAPERVETLVERMNTLFSLAEEWADQPIRDSNKPMPRPRTSLKFMPKTFE